MGLEGCDAPPPWLTPPFPRYSKERPRPAAPAAKVARERGHAGAQIVEIAQHVARSTWTNYINEVAKTEIDFPVITARKAAA
jgi:hypothetical protein